MKSQKVNYSQFTVVLQETARIVVHAPFGSLEGTQKEPHIPRSDLKTICLSEKKLPEYFLI